MARRGDGVYFTPEEVRRLLAVLGDLLETREGPER